MILWLCVPSQSAFEIVEILTKTILVLSVVSFFKSVSIPKLRLEMLKQRKILFITMLCFEISKIKPRDHALPKEDDNMAVLLKDWKRDQSGTPGVFQCMKCLLAWCSPVPIAQDNCCDSSLIPLPGAWLLSILCLGTIHPGHDSCLDKLWRIT